MRFEQKDGEYVYSVDICGDSMSFRCNLLDKEFKTLDGLEAAVKAKKLSLRKNFSNPQAVCIDRWNKKIDVVLVTSLDGDNDAWIKNSNGDRRKVMRSSLYSDVDIVKLTADKEASLMAQIQEVWKSCPLWEPKP